MKLAEDEGIEIKVKQMTRDEIYISDEAFFTGTAAEVTPIRELDDRSIGNGSRGPITEILQKKYFDVVNGKSEKYKDWLTISK
jgi:branched-chain amino acid aminotransferase